MLPTLFSWHLRNGVALFLGMSIDKENLAMVEGLSQTISTKLVCKWCNDNVARGQTLMEISWT